MWLYSYNLLFRWSFYVAIASDLFEEQHQIANNFIVCSHTQGYMLMVSFIKKHLRPSVVRMFTCIYACTCMHANLATYTYLHVYVHVFMSCMCYVCICNYLANYLSTRIAVGMLYVAILYTEKFWQGKIGKFGKLWVIHQKFPHQYSQIHWKCIWHMYWL